MGVILIIIYCIYNNLIYVGGVAHFLCGKCGKCGKCIFAVYTSVIFLSPLMPVNEPIIFMAPLDPIKNHYPAGETPASPVGCPMRMLYLRTNLYALYEGRGGEFCTELPKKQSATDFFANNLHTSFFFRIFAANL